MQPTIWPALESGLRSIAVYMGFLAGKNKKSHWIAPIGIVVVGFLLHAVFVPVVVDAERVLGGAVEGATGMFEGVSAGDAVVATGIVATDVGFQRGVVATAADSIEASALPLFKDTPLSPDELLGRTVLPGETLSDIAHSAGITEKALKAANPKLSSPLIVGEAISIPAGSNAPAVVVESRGGSYLPEGFIWPASGPISQPHGRFAARDIPNLLGAPIVASGDGVVRAVEYGWNGGYGNRVIVDHPSLGIQTLYAHLKDFVVGPGDLVVKGQILGYMGSTGHSTGPHVHFEVRP